MRYRNFCNDTRLLICILGVFLLLAIPHDIYAGFGITPPYVTNASLTRNSVYEQTILLVRNDAADPLRAIISLDIPEINEWFEIVEGTEFIIPAGEQKFPMTVRVTVPDNADFKKYFGNIRIKTESVGGAQRSGVSISLGAQIDVDLVVIDKQIKDFKVRKIGISDLNEGHKVGWLYFPGKISFEMFLENIGNVPVAPSDVVFRIYDKSGRVLLEETRSKGRIEKIDPFEMETVYAEIPTRLPAGSYIGRYEIFNGEEVKQSGELTVSILSYGTLQKAGFGFSGLSLPHKLSVLTPILFVLVLIGVFGYRILSVRKRKRQ